MTPEQKEILKCARKIKEYCDSVNYDCNGCIFRYGSRRYGNCVLCSEPPCCWELPEEVEQ